MPLPETIEKTYLPGDNIDATTMNAVQHGITTNHAHIEQLTAPQLQWLVGRTVGDVTFDADGVATVDGTARVFLDCRLGPLNEIQVRCRLDADGIECKLMDGATVIGTAAITGDGSSWAWVALAVSGFAVTDETRLYLLVVASQPQQVERIAIAPG